MADEITLISHPSVTWPGAVNLRTGIDGFLLGIGRNPLACAAQRLLEEGRVPTDTVIIRDAAGQLPDLRAVIKDALADRTMR
jgi:hypothetical protein